MTIEADDQGHLGGHRPVGLDVAWMDEIEERWSRFANLPVVPLGESQERVLTAPELLAGFRSEVAVAWEGRTRLLSSTTFVTLGRLAATGSHDPATIEIRRTAGELLAVEDFEELLFPAFQFSEVETVTPRPAVPIVNRLLGAPEDSWAVLAWWLDACPALDGSVPAELLGTAPNETEVFERAATSELDPGGR